MISLVSDLKKIVNKELDKLADEVLIAYKKNIHSDTGTLEKGIEKVKVNEFEREIGPNIKVLERAKFANYGRGPVAGKPLLGNNNPKSSWQKIIGHPVTNVKAAKGQYFYEKTLNEFK